MHEELGLLLPWWMVLPFAGLLLSIAIFPLTIPHWFHKNQNMAVVAAGFGLPVLAYLLMQYGEQGWERILETGHEYISFIVLLAALYTISGGIYVTGHLVGTPYTNVGFLLAGAVLANFIGTTGAAMVLIRPLLRANADRSRKKHVIIFFIFIVCNVGGLLTPLADPPLFLGFLRGVSFFWTLQLFPQWAFTVLVVIGIFLILETRAYREDRHKFVNLATRSYLPSGIAGRINFLYLGGVIVAVLLSNPLLELGEAIHFPFLREVIMITMMVLSMKAAPTGPRASNHFSWDPIAEVAIIFAGIFAAMIPALAILEARGGELGLDQPWQFFWSTGVLSSFLDNAPTYLTFTSTAQGLLDLDTTGALMSTDPSALGISPARFLAAISTGAVFMGANSYIGNAPNFMVKSMAEKADVDMPSFFGYMAYSALILVPVFMLVTVVFFR
ncbi:MAG TPA: sodium:proton antiporter [Thermoleophilia bacterium]|nr:sodium:proton antiporter [Thermoleophilia bacterium]